MAERKVSCRDCVHYDVCYLVHGYGADENDPCDRFTAFDNCEVVVRCKNCIHTEYPDRYARPEDKIVWCKRRKVYMPLKGFCSDGKEKEK